MVDDLHPDWRRNRWTAWPSSATPSRSTPAPDHRPPRRLRRRRRGPAGPPAPSRPWRTDARPRPASTPILRGKQLVPLEREEMPDARPTEADLAKVAKAPREHLAEAPGAERRPRLRRGPTPSSPRSRPSPKPSAAWPAGCAASAGSASRPARPGAIVHDMQPDTPRLDVGSVILTPGLRGIPGHPPRRVRPRAATPTCSPACSSSACSPRPAPPAVTCSVPPTAGEVKRIAFIQCVGTATRPAATATARPSAACAPPRKPWWPWSTSRPGPRRLHLLHGRARLRQGVRQLRQPRPRRARGQVHPRHPLAPGRDARHKNLRVRYFDEDGAETAAGIRPGRAVASACGPQRVRQGPRPTARPGPQRFGFCRDRPPGPHGHLAARASTWPAPSRSPRTSPSRWPRPPPPRPAPWSSWPRRAARSSSATSTRGSATSPTRSRASASSSATAATTSPRSSTWSRWPKRPPRCPTSATPRPASTPARTPTSSTSRT